MIPRAALQELEERLRTATGQLAPIAEVVREALENTKASAAHQVAPGILVHGGAGAISRAELTAEDAQAYHRALEDSVLAGMLALVRGSTALDAVSVAVQCLEWCPLFNAGVGSVYRSDGSHRMDASIMDGQTGRFGSVAGSSRILYPVVGAALALWEGEPRGGLVVQGTFADSLAEDRGLQMVDNAHFDTPARRRQWERAQSSGRVHLDHGGEGTRGTVGAVARDAQGGLAAATSTGGLVNVHPGRVGDSAFLGAGTWADQRVAVSGTGQGEQFIRHQTARRVADRMELAGEPLSEAAKRAVGEMPERAGGLIAIDSEGRAAWPRSTEGMYRGQSLDGVVRIGIHDEEYEIPLERLIQDRAAGWFS